MLATLEVFSRVLYGETGKHAACNMQLRVFMVSGQPEQRAVSLRAGAQTGPAGADVHRGHREAEGSAAGKEISGKLWWPPRGY